MTPKSVGLAIPVFGYKNDVGVDKAHELIRTWQTNATEAHVGAQLPDLVRRQNIASDAWAEAAYR